MKINKNTKISQLIKENPDSIDAIVSINKFFEKLRNPFLRKILASRVTIEDAAKIGGTTVQVFFEKLAPLGFFNENTSDVVSKEENSIPDFYKSLTAKNLQELDVRNDIAKGNDPFNEIMDVLAQMPHEKVLKVVNTFEPIPLVNLLARKGYESYTLYKEPSLVYTFFKYSGKSNNYKIPEISDVEISSDDIAKLVHSFGEKIINIDVRDLEMPMPMVTILSELDVLPAKTLLYVVHSKIPVYLFPELDSRGFKYNVKKNSEDEVLVLIYK
jgi:hypothetical protein